ncbi:zinc finger FYVE domain-containing protein 26 isoform X1 [Pleurodeles waltl]|uniref:zinc finger FYVE domain-containing protein 26 isoform X1 n=1 Tax=Pleurodeles waltl TaxID=8319 RepID=UPI0037095FAA
METSAGSRCPPVGHEVQNHGRQTQCPGGRHPFGREEEASLQRLFLFFCQCLQRGEWELAQACIPQLHHWKGQGPIQVEDILRAMVACPYMLRCGESTPQRLAWFWLISLEKWLALDQKPLPAFLRNETEFLLLLEELQSDLMEEVIKELYEVFLHSHCESVEAKKDAISLRLSFQTTNDLQKILSRKPRLAQVLIEFLLSDDTSCSAVEYNNTLQQIYVDFLLASLKSLQKAEGHQQPTTETAHQIYCTLSLMPFDVEHQAGELRYLFKQLVDACIDPRCLLMEEQLLGCLLRKQSRTLINLYENVATERIREMLVGPKTQEKVSSEQSDTERAILALFSDHRQIPSWKRAYFYCLSSDKHFLEQVLVTALGLLKREDFCGLSRLLSNEFKPLGRLLVLLGWTHCQSLDSAKSLLYALHRDKDVCNDFVLKEFCDGLWAQLEVLEWCINQSSGSIAKRDLLQQLHSLDCHSSLYILHHLTNLPALDEDTVLVLLQKALPVGNGATGQFSKRASSSLVQQRSVILFEAFCAMKYAIYALCLNAHKHSMCKDCADNVLSESSGEPELNAAPGNDHRHCQDYSALFKQYLTKCQHYLHFIPAPLCLEVLENIFSLLFISYSDLCTEFSLPEDYAFDEDYEDQDKRSDGLKSLDSSADKGDSRTHSPMPSPQIGAHVEEKWLPKDSKTLSQETHAVPELISKAEHCHSNNWAYLNLKHFTSDMTGFLVDEIAAEAFLQMLLDHLEKIKNSKPWDSSDGSSEKLQLVECLSCSVSRETFESRVLQFSKILSEAQWRYKVVISNRNAEQVLSSQGLHLRVRKQFNHRRRSRARRRKKADKDVQESVVENNGSELSTSTSEGSNSTISGRSELGFRLQPLKRNLLIPMMLSPPESLLISCILRGNFVEAHQVVLMFNLESSACYGELIFMERYQDVVRELAKVEHKIESQTSEANISRRSGSNRSTMQVIGTAVAAGMVVYSISDVTDKLLATSPNSIPTLQEDFWTKSIHLDCIDPLKDVLDDLCPAAMATFDLACTQAHLWKTCKQLLQTAERQLFSNLEMKGQRVNGTVRHPEGIQGFPTVLYQISKILNYLYTSQTQTQSGETAEEKASSQFRCNILDLLLTCYPLLTEDCVINETSVSQQHEQILQKLTTAIDMQEPKANVLATLMEQASAKPQELQAHPVRSQMKLLLKNLDLQMGKSHEPWPDYVRSFFDYINTLAAVLVRSINTDLDHSAVVKVGNPFILLQQKPSQLLSHLLFERQVPPDRLSSLLSAEELNLNVQQIIVTCCCRTLPICSSRKESQAESLVANIYMLTQQLTETRLPGSTMVDLSLFINGERSICEELSFSPGDSSQYALTASTLEFLISQSKLTAVIACLSASKVQKAPKTSLSWKEFIGSKKESPLEMEQIAKECELLLKEFPILQSFLTVMLEPVDTITEEEGGSPVGALCGKTCVSLILSGLHSSTSASVLTEAFQHSLTSKDWHRAGLLLDMYAGYVEDLPAVRDLVLCCAAVEDQDGWRYLMAVKNATLRSRIVLHFLEKWPLEACLEILAYSISDSSIDEELKIDLQKKKRELHVYQKILSLQGFPKWNNWQDLMKDCTADLQTVMNVILQAKDYGLCEEWGHLYPVPFELLISLHREHLLHLLESGEMEQALQLLQRMSDPGMCQAISEEALSQKPCLEACHFLADYLTTHFQKSLSAVRHNEIQALYIGCKMLLALPVFARANYEHLTSRPLLLLEQLLMNIKVDWAATAVQTLHQLLIGQEAGFTTEDVDDLLARYAEIALHFPFSFREEKRPDSESRLPESLSQATESETLSIASTSEHSSLSFPASTRFQTPPPPREKGPRRRSKSSPDFVPPERPPARRHWIPDERENTCMVCKNEQFTMFNRRHHCRRCGRLVCSSCSTKKMVVEGCRENPARVCDQCFSFYTKDSAEDDGCQMEDDDDCLDLAAVLQLSKTSELQWRLTLNEEENEVERSEFYYEQAPSASLCIAILSLHCDSIACGHLLIHHSCVLSRALNNPEMDSRLLIDIMKNLIFSAKMMFVKAGRSQDLALCDSYYSKVDLLKILVANTYPNIPSLDQILQPAAVIRLRNRLLEAEYYQLAIEVSTKSGLDPTGVWHAWGMACLKAANLPAAREKFERFLKAPADLNQLNQGSRVVQDVTQHLESAMKPIVAGKDDDYIATLKDLETTLKTGSLWLEMMPEGKVQQNAYYKECLYYLETYGTNLALISFLMRHDCMREALLHLLKKQCPGEVFLDGIFIPSYKSGKLHVLENLLEAIDPSLEKWSTYLFAACKHLQQKNFYHILYELQKFMKDNVRAAMTCIRFFYHRAKNYTELGEKQKWMTKAKDHLRVYLQDISRSFGRKKPVSTFRKKMTASDVSRHISTVEMQIEVTRFLHRCESSGTAKIMTTPPPTLFGSDLMKEDVACTVMLGGKNVEEGFGIAFRVIQDFQLDPASVYIKVSKHLLKRQHFGEFRQLLKCVRESGVAAENDIDNIIFQSLQEHEHISGEELDKLVQEMSDVNKKINAYVMCSKLRSAYLIAVKQEHERAIQLVEEVKQVAVDRKDNVIRQICAKWLSEHPPAPKGKHSHSARK